MDTSNRDLNWFLERLPERPDIDPASLSPEDWGRLSIEAFVARDTGTARVMRSEGSLRLHGSGVRENTAELAHVGNIAAAWQKAVSATGAALENHRSLRGTLPTDITRRTTLALSAAPGSGSIVLQVEPQADPMDEVEPHGNISLGDPPRPLADRASEELIALLSQAGRAEQALSDELVASLRALGPRVGSALAALTQTIHRSGITVDASWAEPGVPTVKASINPSTAKWLRDFVAGRGLDAEEQTLIGTLRTVSDRERWLVELPNGETERMSANQLPPEEVTKWHVGALVNLRVRVALREQPDGTVRRTHTILALSPADD
jgi:hypothetical protein